MQQPDTVNIAQAFTTGGNPSGYSLSGLRFGIKIDTDVDALSWALHDDAAGEPAAEPLFTEIAVPSESLDRDNNTFEDLVHPGFPLAPDTKYWAVLTASPLMEGGDDADLGRRGDLRMKTTILTWMGRRRSSTRAASPAGRWISRRFPPQ